ncbi:MAG: hypothetical protein SV429_12955, partial [Pseudomonadota bacterium]|nr:hypothetical protein [Pseudomonadota bacterium]
LAKTEGEVDNVFKVLEIHQGELKRSVSLMEGKILELKVEATCAARNSRKSTLSCRQDGDSVLAADRQYGSLTARVESLSERVRVVEQAFREFRDDLNHRSEVVEQAFREFRDDLSRRSESNLQGSEQIRALLQEVKCEQQRAAQELAATGSSFSQTLNSQRGGLRQAPFFSSREEEVAESFGRSQSTGKAEQETLSQKRVSHAERLDTSDSEEDKASSRDRKRRERGRASVSSGGMKVKELPRMVKYTGKKPWRNFLSQFNRYKAAQQWTDSEAIQYFGLFLEDDALSFYDQLPVGVQQNLTQSLEALGRRFGASTIQAQKAIFKNLVQFEKETYQEFADRVRSCAIDAFPDLPQRHVEGEIIQRFFEGIRDKDAGLVGMVKHFTSVEAAVEHTLLYIESRKALYGSKKVLRVLEPDSDPEQLKVNRVRFQEPEKPQKEEDDKIRLLLSKLEECYERQVEHLSREKSL